MYKLVFVLMDGTRVTFTGEKKPKYKQNGPWFVMPENGQELVKVDCVKAVVYQYEEKQKPVVKKKWWQF